MLIDFTNKRIINVKLNCYHTLLSVVLRTCSNVFLLPLAWNFGQAVQFGSSFPFPCSHCLTFSKCHALTMLLPLRWTSLRGGKHKMTSGPHNCLMVDCFAYSLTSPLDACALLQVLHVTLRIGHFSLNFWRLACRPRMSFARPI